MKVAIGDENGFVASHLGRCKKFIIASVVDGQVQAKNILNSPISEEKGLIPSLLAANEIDYLICGGLGHKAKVFFADKGISVIVGVTGKIEEVLTSFIKGELLSLDNLCDH